MKVQTVLGLVDASDLGRTLTHEHFSLDFTCFYRPPPVHLQSRYEGCISLQNLGYIRQMPYSSKDNLKFDGSATNEAVLNDVLAYKKYGGGTIVENTTFGLNGSVEMLKNVSENTNVHVVAGTGFYVADLQNQSTLSMKKEDIYEHMMNELTVGYNVDKSIKAGFMGEIASVWPIHDFEKRVIKATGEIQEQLGCGVSFHPHRDKAAPFEVMRLYLEAGGRANKAVMSHIDRTLLDDESVLEFSKIGCYCQWDLFGVEVSHYQLHLPTDMPSDAQRISKIKKLVDEGKIDRILMSHDIHTKHRLIDFGGHGYSHIINNVLPKMKMRGFDDEQIDQITIKNPANWLGF